ncbi:MAG TPA: hypothetical protein PLS03_08135 [Terrimicrobiaceae bacterium]|nr:hypothetical protein [Terrimicrobiaceae bacterium]
MLITRRILDEANYRVTLELRTMGLYCAGMAQVITRLVPFGLSAYGWKYRGREGEIHIPAVTLARLGEIAGHPRVGLRDILRHEFGHALVDLHPGLFRTAEFRRVFGGPVSNQDPWEYDPDLFISPYAATCPEEDFCETFMVWMGRRRNFHEGRYSPEIRRKLRFVGALSLP